MLQGIQGLGILLLLAGMAGSAWLSYQALRRRVAYLEREHARLQQEVAQRDERYAQFYHAVDAVTRDKAKAQLAMSPPFDNPPEGILPTLRLMLSVADIAADPYYFPVGWQRRRNGEGTVSLFSAHPLNEHFCGNISVSGETRYGKGNLVALTFLALCLRLNTTVVSVVSCSLEGSRSPHGRSVCLTKTSWYQQTSICLMCRSGTSTGAMCNGGYALPSSVLIPSTRRCAILRVSSARPSAKTVGN